MVQKLNSIVRNPHFSFIRLRGMGGDLVASVSTMAKVDTIGKTFSNAIRICPILIDYFVVSKYKIIELSIETTHLFENRVL